MVHLKKKTASSLQFILMKGPISKADLSVSLVSSPNFF